MSLDGTSQARVVDRQVCVVFDGTTGQIAQIHESVTLEGAEPRSRQDVEARAMELAREYASQLPWVQYDRLEVLHLPAEDLPDGNVERVDLETRQVVIRPPTTPPPLA